MDSSTFVPQSFYCPISGDLMNNPVSDREGHSYEKAEILLWLKKSKTSPMTRSYLDESHLIENDSLKRSIDEIKDQLNADQMKIDSRIVSDSLQTFTDSIDKLKINPYYLNDNLYVNIQIPDIEVRPPVDIVLCIDVSASMEAEATLKGDSNETISHGFSVLSLTVSAAKTILHSLNEHDHISIVTYSADACTLFENTPCTPENKQMIDDGLDSLKPTYNTNMWAGIIRSLDILQSTSHPQRVKGVLLLTDGIPNVEPPRGHEYMLEKYFTDHNFKCMISCYGFGYNLLSELLMNLSDISGGDGYSFIPDASLLGNIFIHGLSNLFTTATHNPSLSVTLKNDIRFKDNGRSSQTININSIKYGQDKNIFLLLDTSSSPDRSQDFIASSIEVSLTIGTKVYQSESCIRPTRDYYIEQLYRHKVINLIQNCILLKRINDMSFKSQLTDMIAEMQQSSGGNQYVKHMITDLSGQVMEALNMTSQGEREDWFNRWGIHYLRSLMQAYKNEICNNFKDKGVSNFGGKLFDNLRDSVSSVFDSMPPPKADLRKPPPVIRGRGPCQQQHVVRAAAPVNMRQYNTASGGCCSGDSMIHLTSGVRRKAEEIKKGDQVVTFYSIKDDRDQYHETYSLSKIECVIKTYCEDGHQMMVQLDDLTITPYHPIIDLRQTKDWSFPLQMNKHEYIRCPVMYTFITENRQHLLAGKYVYATLGHNSQEDIIHHDYFGSENVIDDLKQFDTYSDGYINLIPSMFRRDGYKNKVIGIGE